MKIVNIIALILNIIGGINWGLVGLFRFDLVAWICGGQDSVFARIIYSLVGLAAIWCIIFILLWLEMVSEIYPDSVRPLPITT